MKTYKDRDLSNTIQSFQELSKKHVVVIQWIPSHCDLLGNEKADELAKQGTLIEQADNTTSFAEEKTILKRKMKQRWTQEHQDHNPNDPYYSLSRQEQVIIFRLRTNHHRLRSHLFNKFKIGDSDLCPCGEDSETTEHVLQRCPNYQTTRNSIWPVPREMTNKLHGNLEDLQRTASFIVKSGVTV